MSSQQSCKHEWVATLKRVIPTLDQNQHSKIAHESAFEILKAFPENDDRFWYSLLLHHFCLLPSHAIWAAFSTIPSKVLDLPDVRFLELVKRYQMSVNDSAKRDVESDFYAFQFDYRLRSSVRQNEELPSYPDRSPLLRFFTFFYRFQCAFHLKRQSHIVDSLYQQVENVLQDLYVPEVGPAIDMLFAEVYAVRALHQEFALGGNASKEMWQLCINAYACWLDHLQESHPVKDFRLLRAVERMAEIIVHIDEVFAQHPQKTADILPSALRERVAAFLIPK